MRKILLFSARKLNNFRLRHLTILLILCYLYPWQLYAQPVNTTLSDIKLQTLLDSVKKSYKLLDANSFNNTIERFYQSATGNQEQFSIDSWIQQVYILGVEYWKARDTIAALNLLYPVYKNNWSPKTETGKIDLGRTYNLLGVIQRANAQLNDALASYNKAIVVFQECKKVNPITFPAIYSNIGNTYRRLGDFTKAVEYLTEADRYSELGLAESYLDPKIRKSLIKNQITLLNNLGLALEASRESDKAIIIYQKAKNLAKINHSPKLASILHNLSISYRSTQELDKAEESILQALNMYPKNSTSVSIARYSNSYLGVLRQQKKNEEFKKQFPGILHNISILPYSSARNLSLAVSYILESSLYESEDQILLSLEDLQTALKYLDENKKISKDWHSVPGGNIRQNPFRYLEIIDHKARNLMKLYHNTGDITLAINAFNHLRQAEVWTDSIRINLKSRESRIILNNIQSTIYQRKADVCYELYLKTNDEHYVNEAFTSCEKGKAAGMWTEIQLTDLKSELLPDNLIEKERFLRTHINELSGMISELSETRSQESKALQSLKAQKFRAQTSLDSLITIFDKQYPEYYSMKYANKTISLDEIRSLLSDDQIMIQFFTSQNYMHQIVISSDHIEYNQITNLQNIYDLKASLLSHMSKPVFNYHRADVKNYIKAAYGLYVNLIANINTDLSGKKIIILPDVKLADIPFAALVSDSNYQANTDFRDLSYIIKDYQITYSYTASLWAYQPRKELPKSRTGTILAYSPSYDPITIENSPTINKFANILTELKGTKEEIDYLNRNFKGSFYSGEKATELSFKEHAHSRDVIHLAMHALPDKNDPLQSAMVFTPGSDSRENGMLTAAEILNLKLNASLTVLSACNTGSGKIETGEGIMSLARSFMIAGSPGIVLSLWSLDDRIGKDLIEAFYQSMANGYSIAESLRLSKIRHLEKTNKLMAHPYFWAGLINLGHDQKVMMKRHSSLPWLIPLIAIIAFLLLHLLRNKKKAVAKATARDG